MELNRRDWSVRIETNRLASASQVDESEASKVETHQSRHPIV